MYQAHLGAAGKSFESLLQSQNLWFPLFFLKAQAGMQLDRFSWSSETKMQHQYQRQALKTAGKHKHCWPAHSAHIFLPASAFANFTNDILLKGNFISGFTRTGPSTCSTFCIKYHDAQSRRGCGSVIAYKPPSQFGREVVFIQVFKKVGC